MPVPELYVIYTGNKPNVPESISLNKEFFGGKNGDLDITVKILNNKDDKNIIGEYITFCKVYDEQFKLYGRTEKSVSEAIRICKDKEILSEYLKEHESEVTTIMMSLFSEESLSRAYDAELKRKYEEKLQSAVQSTERETAQRVERDKSLTTAIALLTMGKLSLDDISKATGLSLSEVEELSKNNARLS